ncbi:universal stress protein [Streptomyces sp. NBC_00400]|uniref:universal stress protein n=1 Tax=Streptomyces sp. NBC_00400 TaxID=2975737 RepID=UPI002E1ED51D
MKDLVTVGLDGTLQSLSAALWAAREAELRKARLQLLHAWILLAPEPTGAPSEEAEENYWPHRIIDEAQTAVASSHPDLPVDVSLVRGEPSDALAKAAEQSDLLVLGSRGLGAAARFTLGEIGLELVTRTAVPTVLVRARQDTPARIGSGNVTVGVSLHAACDGLLAFAFETAARRAVPLRAVHGSVLCGLPRGLGTVDRERRDDHRSTPLSPPGQMGPMHPAWGPTGPCAGHALRQRLGMKAPHSPRARRGAP